MIDVQCFAGGMTLGVAQAGFELVGKREMPPEPGFGTPLLEANRHLLGNRWQAQATLPEEWQPYQVPLVISNPPCSGFSGLTAGIKSFHGMDSPINKCMWETVRFAAKCNPDIVIFESVQGAYSKGRPLMLALREELERLTLRGWDLYHVKHNVSTLGGFCTRRRYFWTAVREGLPFDVEYPAVSTPRTVKDAIGDLVGVPLGWEADPELGRPDGHALGKQGLRDVRKCDFLQPYWGEGETLDKAAWRFLEANPSLPTDIFPPRNEEKLRLMGSWYFTQPNKMHWEKPGRVIDGGSFGRFYHPLLHRTISFREGARIMGYPDDWSLLPIKDHRIGDNWLGKGVCPTAGRWIGDAARRALTGETKVQGGELIGERERLIWVK